MGPAMAAISHRGLQPSTTRTPANVFGFESNGGNPNSGLTTGTATGTTPAVSVFGFGETGGGRITSASKTRWRDHQRHLSQLNNATLSGVRKPTKQQLSGTPSWRKNTLARLIGAVRRTSSASSSQEDTGAHDPDVIGEFDHDVSEAMVTLGGRFVGLNPQELLQSQGLRKLVARNIRWFQNTPDWLKLIGLVVAKRLNSAVRSTVGSNRGDEADPSSYRIEGLAELLPLTHQQPAAPLPVAESPPPPPLASPLPEENVVGEETMETTAVTPPPCDAVLVVPSTKGKTKKEKKATATTTVHEFPDTSFF